MTEFQELVKDAPRFASMERSELVAYAYGMYAAGAKAEAENAKLRDERDTYRDLVGCMVHPDIPDQLQAENAKLRELVLDIYEAYEGEVNDCWLVEFRERMRELGIEVDG